MWMANPQLPERETPNKPIAPQWISLPLEGKRNTGQNNNRTNRCQGVLLDREDPSMHGFQQRSVASELRGFHSN